MTFLRSVIAACTLLAGAMTCGAAAPVQVAAQPAQPAMPAPSGAGQLVRVADGRMLAPDIARIVNRKSLVVALQAADQPPFFSVRNGALTGIDVELVTRVANELKVDVRFDRTATSFDGVAEAVAAGKADLGISRLARTLKRAQYVQFSDTYMRLNHAFLINRVQFAKLAGDRPLPQVVRSFDGKLGVLEKSSWVEFGHRNFPNAKVVEFKSWPELVEAVKGGTVTAAYRDELEVRQIIKRAPDLALTLSTVTFDDLESPLSIMIGIGDPTLHSFVNEVIAQWVDKPTVKTILKGVQ